MNFVETAKPLLYATDSQNQAPQPAVVQGLTVKSDVAPCSMRGFLMGFVAAMALFPFTLYGLTAASSWLAETFVVPRIVNQDVAEFSTPVTFPSPDAEESAESLSTASPAVN